MAEKLKKNLIPLAIIGAGILIAGALYFTQGKEALESETLSSQEIAERAIEYINANILAEGNTASLIDIVEEGDVYKIQLKIGDQEYDSYASKDGKLLFPEGYSLEEQTETQDETLESQPEASPEKLEALAKCLTERSVKFYGAYWCSWCNRQKESFGEAAQYLPYIECADKETGEMTSQCQTEGISSFPTWEFEGEKALGFKEPEELAKLSGCPF